MNNQSRVEAAEAVVGSEWYRSPLVLLAGLVLFAGVIAAVVVGVTSGGDEAVTTTAVDPTASVITSAPTLPSFGGPDVPETDEVVVTGEPLPQFTTPAEDTALGVAAPVIEATSLGNGTPVELGPGQARVIGFFAHWCPHCQSELPELRAWLNNNELPPSTQFIAVSTATNPARDNYPPSAWFTAEQWPAPVVVDDENATLLNAFGFTGFPAFVAVDASGVVVKRAGGNIGAEGVADMFEVFASSASG